MTKFEGMTECDDQNLYGEAGARARATSHIETSSPSPRPSPIGWERENGPPSSRDPIALEIARDGSGCSLSCRTGEGQGEGRFV